MSKKNNIDAHKARYAAFRAGRDERTAAFDMVGGGDFEKVGFLESLVLQEFAPIPKGGMLIDVGCGPGRLVRYLTERSDIRVLGTDVVSELIDVAIKECNRNDWDFVAVDGFFIPADNETADVVSIFSVFTNMYPEQSYLLIEESYRALKKGGKLLITYMDITTPQAQRTFSDFVVHQDKRIDPLAFLDKHFIDFFAKNIGFQSPLYKFPSEIALTAKEDARLLDGREVTGPLSWGQTVAVMTK